MCAPPATGEFHPKVAVLIYRVQHARRHHRGGYVHGDEHTCRADEMRDEWFSVSTVLTGEQVNGEVVTSSHQFNLVNAVPRDQHLIEELEIRLGVRMCHESSITMKNEPSPCGGGFVSARP